MSKPRDMLWGIRSRNAENADVQNLVRALRECLDHRDVMCDKDTVVGKVVLTGEREHINVYLSAFDDRLCMVLNGEYKGGANGQFESL